MASIIKIKRSGVTGQPTSLKLGELAVSYLIGTQSNGGDRVYIGTGGVDGSGNANDISVIGGKYFTDMLDHVAGTVTASSALIVDASRKLNELLVDNITIDGNTISTTNTNGNLVLDPNGQGKVDVSGAIVTNAGTPSSNTDLATKGYVDQVSGAALLTINGDAGTDTVNLADSSVNFVTGDQLTTTVTDNTITIELDSTGVEAGTYGSSSEIPIVRVNKNGLIDSVGIASINTDFTIAGDAGSNDVFNTGGTLTFTGTDPVQTTISNNTVTISVDDATTSTKGIAQFSSDNFAVASGEVTIKDGGVVNAELANSTIRINSNTVSLGDSATLDTDDIGEGSTNQYFTNTRARAAVSHVDAGGDGSFTYDNGTGVFTYTGPSASETRAHFSAGTGVSIVNGVVAIGQAVDSTDDVIFNDVRTSGDVTVDGDLTVHGTTTTVNSVTVTTNDPLMHLADSNETTDAVDIGFVAQYYSSDNTRVERTGFFRDATDDTYKLFTGLVQDDLDSNNTVDIAGTGFAYADIRVGTLTATNINGSLEGSYSGFDSDFTQKLTDQLTEGDINLYFTTDRVDSALTGLLVAGEGIDIVDGSGTYTFSVEDASETNKGIATFDGTNFTVTSGDVTTNDITITTGSGSAAITNGETLQIKGTSAAGITTTADSATRITLNVVASTLTQRGTASFGGYADSAGEGTRQFSVTAGDVSIAAIDGGWF